MRRSYCGARLSGGWAGLRGEGARVGRLSTGGEGGESLLLLLRKRGARVGRDRRPMRSGCWPGKRVMFPLLWSSAAEVWSSPRQGSE